MEEEEEDKIYQQERQRHLHQLEEEMRKALRLEDDELQKIEEEYRLKNDELVRQFEQEMRMKQLEKEQMEQNSKKKIEDLKYT